MDLVEGRAIQDALDGLVRLTKETLEFADSLVEARKTPAEGGVFFLDFYLYRTTRLTWNWDMPNNVGVKPSVRDGAYAHSALCQPSSSR
jgi:hypothetical protein